MYKKNIQSTTPTHQNNSRRSSCPASKDKPKKKDFLTSHKNGSAQIPRNSERAPKRGSEALGEREANHLYTELQQAHTNLPKPEAHPTLQDQEEEGYHSNTTPRSKDLEQEEIARDFVNMPPIVHEERTGTTKPQSMQSKSVERSSKIFTESDEEKEDDREHDKKPDVEYPMDVRIEDLHTELERLSHNRIPSTQGGRTFNIDQAPLTGPDLNASHSSKSTVLLAESPRGGSGGKNREHQMTQETEGSADTKEPEIQESYEIRPPKSVTTEASKVIDSAVAHDVPLIQPKAQEVSHANIVSMKNKINLEIYLKVENLLYVIKESIMSGKPIFQFCRDYIEVAPKIDREHFEKTLATEQEKKLVKSSFIVKRLGIILMLYFTVENTPNEKAMFQLKSLINGIHQNFIIVGYLISLKLKDKSKSNVWTARLMELLEHDSSSNFTKNENLDKLAYNNTNLCNIMKNLIVSMRNKEILYAFNSIVIQLDRISIKEAYTRLLKSFSVFMSEKELKSQVSQYMPKKPVQESKIQQILKVEKKKDELAFLPKLVKGGVESQFTLVVDLDETLVHYAELPGKLNELRVRPYVAHFLTEVSKYYEIVVFTAAMQEYADWVLDNIDKDHCVTHRLYRQHASPDGYNFVKDLSKLGRDMARIMIVDNLAENFRLQPDNGIYIKPWYDDPEDTALLELTPLLVEIARKKVTDVRVALRRFRDQMIENIEKGFDNPHLNLQLD